MAYDTVSAI